MQLSLSNGLTTRAEKIITKNTLYASGTGLIPIPILDFASTLAVQLSMVKALAGEYGISGKNYNKHQVKSIIGILTGNLTTVSLVKYLPVIGNVLGGATLAVTCAASTYALGRVFAIHFAAGGTILDFNPETTRQYFLTEFERATYLPAGR